MRTGKIIHQHRAGKGKTSVHRLTVLRAGPIGDTGAGKRVADMFVDPSPYLSMSGLDIERTRDPRGNTMRNGDESHIQSRTGGKHTPKQHDARSHHNGSVNLVAKGQFGNGR
jgi:hypothetical protein